MDYSQKDILDALHMIANICGSNADCDTCPLFSERNGKCCFEQYQPSRLPFIDKEPEIWRAIF